MDRNKAMKNDLTFAQLSADDRTLLERINEYADRVLADIDPQKTQVSYQLEKLKPVMEILARERNTTLEEIFIKYMDLASLFSVENENKFQEEFNNPDDSGNVDFRI